MSQTDNVEGHDIQLDYIEKCVECGRTFDLQDVLQSVEWFFGHDCEPMETVTK